MFLVHRWQNIKPRVPLLLRLIIFFLLINNMNANKWRWINYHLVNGRKYLCVITRTIVILTYFERNQSQKWICGRKLCKQFALKFQPNQHLSVLIRLPLKSYHRNRTDLFAHTLSRWPKSKQDNTLTTWSNIIPKKSI